MKVSYSGVFSMSVLSTLFAHGPLRSRSRSGVGAAAIELSAIIFFFPFFFFFTFFPLVVNRDFYSIGTLGLGGSCRERDPIEIAGFRKFTGQKRTSRT